MTNIRNNFIDSIGNTPLIKLKAASEITGCNIYGKAEFLNPGGSVKDRAALALIKDAQKKKLISKGGIAPSINSNDQRNMKRHPTLEDNVVVGSGAQILGPITIGKNSLVGSNSVVTKNVSEKSVMAGIPAKKVGDALKGFKPYAVTDEEKEK